MAHSFNGMGGASALNLITTWKSGGGLIGQENINVMNDADNVLYIVT